MEKELYDVFLIEQYDKDGEKKNRYIPIGTGFAHKNGKGINIRIKKGLSVSGEFSIFHRREKESTIEMLTMD